MLDGPDNTLQPLYIPPEQILTWMDRLRPHIQKMADGSGGRYETSDILTCLATGAMQCFVAIEGIDLLAVMLTEIMNYPRFRAMRCIGISGRDAPRWTHLMTAIERVAKDNFGCTRIEAMLPARLERLLTTGGWQPFHNLLEKDLT